MNRHAYIWLMLLAFCCIAFKSEKDALKAAAKSLLDRKVKDYMTERRADCRNRAIMEAVIHVDSILYESFESPLSDTVAFPMKPAKPQDSIQMAIDSMPVVPLMKNEKNPH